MVAPVLNDFEYQFGDSGVLLNPLTPGVALYDVTEVDGLDMAPVRTDIQPRDGAHGAHGYAKYLSERVIEVFSTLYGPVGTLETYLDTLKNNFGPTPGNFPFYWKHAGIGQRYCMGKSMGLRYKNTAERRLGVVVFQAIVLCEDPRAYVTNTVVTPTKAVAFNLTNSGNLESYPVFTITGIHSGLNIAHPRGAIRTSASGAAGGDVIVFDCGLRTITKNGADISATINVGDVWPIVASGVSSMTITTTSGTPALSVASYSAWY